MIEVQRNVNISVQKLLAKMEEELKQARESGKDERLREKVYSIKILCELILDEKQTMTRPVQTAAVQPVVQQQTFTNPAMFQQQPAPQTLNQQKKLEMDDEANGDSLFDF